MQVIGHHGNFLRKVLKGCLLSRKVTLLQSLVQLKKQAGTLTSIIAALHIQPDDPGESMSELDTVPKGDLHMIGMAYSTVHRPTLHEMLTTLSRWLDLAQACSRPVALSAKQS